MDNHLAHLLVMIAAVIAGALVADSLAAPARAFAQRLARGLRGRG